MFAFLGWVFWLAVFLAGIFFLFASSTFNLDIEHDEEKENENGAPAFNDWTTTATLIIALLAAMLSSWWMGFLYVFIFFFFLFWLYMTYQVLIYFGVEFNSKGAELLQKFQKEVMDNGFPKKYAPLTTTIFASFFISVISLSGLDSGSSSSSSYSSNSSGSSSKATSSEIANIAKREYVSESKVKEWIDMIGFDELKSMRTSRSFECMDANSNYCLAQGKLDDAVRKKAGEQGCKKDWRKCSSAMEWARADEPYNMSGAKSACYEAINQSQGENVLKAYGRNALGRYDKEIKNGNIIVHSTDFKYSCSYNIETKKAKSI